MRYLADTHILLWALEDNPKMPDKAREIFMDETVEICYSFVNIWEVAIRHSVSPQKIPFSSAEFERLCKESEYTLINTRPEHAIAVESLKYDFEAAKEVHRDPFDRLLIAQAKVDGLRFITHDHLIPYYNEPCVVKV